MTTATNTDPQTVLGGSATPRQRDCKFYDSKYVDLRGIAEFELANPVVAFQGSGTADAPHLVIHLNTLGRSSIQIAYNLRDVDGSGTMPFSKLPCSIGLAKLETLLTCRLGTLLMLAPVRILPIW